MDLVENLVDPITDWSEDQKGINFTAEFTLVFTRDKRTLYDTIVQKHSQRMNPMQVFMGSSHPRMAKQGVTTQVNRT